MHQVRFTVIGVLTDREKLAVDNIIKTTLSQHEWAAPSAELINIQFQGPQRPFSGGNKLIVIIRYEDSERTPTATERVSLLDDIALQLFLKSGEFSDNKSIEIEVKASGPDVPEKNIKMSTCLGGRRGFNAS